MSPEQLKHQIRQLESRRGDLEYRIRTACYHWDMNYERSEIKECERMIHEKEIEILKQKATQL